MTNEGYLVLKGRGQIGSGGGQEAAPARLGVSGPANASVSDYAGGGRRNQASRLRAALIRRSNGVKIHGLPDLRRIAFGERS